MAIAARSNKSFERQFDQNEISNESSRRNHRGFEHPDLVLRNVIDEGN